MDGIKNLIFDFGGVIINIARSQCVEAFEQLGVADVGEKISNSYKSKNLFKLLETGLISAGEFRDDVRHLTEQPLDDQQIDAAWIKMLDGVASYKLDLLLELRKRYNTMLDSPLDANQSRMDIVFLGNGYNNRIFQRIGVGRRFVAFRTIRRAEWTESDGLYFVINNEIKQFRLLKMRMQFHLITDRFDPAVTQQPFHLFLCHVRSTDVAYKSHVDGFTISGEGTINGNGERYWRSFWLRRAVNLNCTNMDELRPRLLFISNCNDVQLSGVSFKDSPFWTTHLYKCNHVFLPKDILDKF